MHKDLAKGIMRFIRTVIIIIIIIIIIKIVKGFLDLVYEPLIVLESGISKHDPIYRKYDNNQTVIDIYQGIIRYNLEVQGV